jgi:prepilin-type N-terminal cleavage/methylation domain-containing protein
VARGRRPFAGGFTLIEMMIVLVIIALVTVVTVVGLRGLVKSDLRSTSSRMAASIRYLFDRASTTGRVHRLVLDFDNGKYWAEVTEDDFTLGPGRETEESRKKEAEKVAKEEEAEREAAEKESFFGASQIPARYLPKPFVPKRAKFEAFHEIAIKPVTLKSGVYLEDFYTPRLLKPLDKGKGYLYFFPMGMTEAAVIHLSDGKEASYSLIVHPLTGRVVVKNSYVEPDTEQQVDDSGTVVTP